MVKVADDFICRFSGSSNETSEFVLEFTKMGPVVGQALNESELSIALSIESLGTK